jgi:hypothetical protein
MPNFIQKQYTNPETFRRFRPDLLFALLKQSEGYFKKRGLLLPGTDEQLALPINPESRCDTSTGFDYDALVRVFMEPTPDMPSELVEGLHLIHEVGRPGSLDNMLDEARTNGLELGLGDNATPEDVALKLLLMDRRLLENVHHCRELKRRRKFQYFTTDAAPIPRLHEPKLEQLRGLERRLEAFYVASHCGPGTRVFAYCQQKIWHDSPEWLFLVRHGAPYQREGSMERGEPASVFYRPRRHAVLKYDTSRGEMGIYCKTPREQRVLLRSFGICLFGRPDFFPGRAKFDLRPLVERGRACLACADIPGIEQVRLTEVEFFRRTEPWRRELQQADDIFSLIEGQKIQWPEDINEFTRATFTVKFWRQKKARQVTIVPCNRALYTRDEDSPIFERWLEAREVIRPVTVLQE